MAKITDPGRSVLQPADVAGSWGLYVEAPKGSLKAGTKWLGEVQIQLQIGAEVKHGMTKYKVVAVDERVNKLIVRKK